MLAVFSFLHAQSLKTQFPSWRYVLWEFDIDESYMDDPYFTAFAKKKKSKLTRLYRRVERDKAYLIRLIRTELLRMDMSDLFLYMSIVESALRCDAVSSKKAKGIWQFMPSTAHRYKLTCKGEDKRSDPVAATQAAIAYLYDLYDRFGKWYLAVMAYNCGEGCVKRAISKAGTDDISILTDDKRGYLPKETRHYLRSIVLMAMIAESDTIRVDENTEPLVLSENKVRTCPVIDTVSAYRTQQTTTLRALSKRFLIEPYILQCLNPKLSNTLKKGTFVIVPHTVFQAKRK
jgi:membrane-bound lytic murein transglycosylase D